MVTGTEYERSEYKHGTQEHCATGLKALSPHLATLDYEVSDTDDRYADAGGHALSSRPDLRT